MTYDEIGIVDGVASLRYVENIITNFKKELSKGIKNLNSFKVILLDYPHIKDNSPTLYDDKDDKSNGNVYGLYSNRRYIKIF